MARWNHSDRIAPQLATPARPTRLLNRISPSPLSLPPSHNSCLGVVPRPWPQCTVVRRFRWNSDGDQQRRFGRNEGESFEISTIQRAYELSGKVSMDITARQRLRENEWKNGRTRRTGEGEERGGRVAETRDVTERAKGKKPGMAERGEGGGSFQVANSSLSAVESNLYLSVISLLMRLSCCVPPDLYFIRVIARIQL